MAYIGKVPNTAIVNQATSQSFSGNGSTTAFTLTRSVNVGEDLEVFVNNVQQEPGSGKSYTASGTTLTFDEAPPSGTNNVYVIYRGEATINPRLEHDANAALAATTGAFSGAVTVANGLTVDDDGATVLTVDRATSNGNVTEFQKDGTTVGAIGIANGDNLYISSDDTNDVGIKFNGDGNRITPCDVSGADRDNLIDLGEGSARFKDLYLGGNITANNLPVANTPVVVARKSSNQSLSRGTWTKITGFDVNSSTDAAVGYDPDNVFDGSRFTVPSGGAGRYLCSANLRFYFGDAGNDGEHAIGAFYVNGGQKTHFTQMSMDNGGRHMTSAGGTGAVIFNLSVGDYVEVYAYIVDDSASGTLKIQGENSTGSQVGFFRID